MSKCYQYEAHSERQRSVAWNPASNVLDPRALRLPVPYRAAKAQPFCVVEWPGPRRESGRLNENKNAS